MHQRPASHILRCRAPSTIGDRLKQLGWTVQKEYPIGGGEAVDLVATKNGRKIAFEVETGHSDIAANVRKIPPGKFDKVVVVLTSAGARAKAVAARLERSDVEVIGATNIEDFLAKEEGTLWGQKSERQA